MFMENYGMKIIMTQLGNVTNILSYHYTLQHSNSAKLFSSKGDWKYIDFCHYGHWIEIIGEIYIIWINCIYTIS